MIRSLLAFTVVVTLAATKVRADLVTYTMTGTVKNAGFIMMTSGGSNSASELLPVAVGDHLSWTLQYDRATPLSQSLSMMGTTNNVYNPSGPAITNLVDLTRGISLYTAPPGSIPANSSLNGVPNTSLHLMNGSTGGGVQFVDTAFRLGAQDFSHLYGTQLNLTSSGPLPTMNLAKLQLDAVPFRFNDNSLPAAFQFTYNGVLNDGAPYSFSAQINSLSADASIRSVPEPATLTLFALGAAGLVLGRVRRLRGQRAALV